MRDDTTYFIKVAREDLRPLGNGGARLDAV